LPVAAAQAKVFLAVQGVGGEQDAVQAQPLDQRPGRRDLVALGDLLVGQDERRLAGEGAQHVRGRLVVQVVEAAPERLAVERDHARSRGRRPVGQRPGMLAEGGLQLGRLERQEETAQRVHGRRSTEARAEHRVEALPVHADEGQDAAVGGGAGEDGQHGEEQQVGEWIAAPLPAARVGDRFQGGEQAGERYHGGSSAGGWSPSTAHAPPRSVSPRCRPSRTLHAQHRTALGLRHGCLRSDAADRAELPLGAAGSGQSPRA
jgi:hypothetical protein